MNVRWYTQQSPPPTHQWKEIFILSLQFKSMLVKPTQGLTFFIIFTSTESTSSMLIPFILKEFILSWISLIQFLGFPSSEAQLFSKLIVWSSLVVLFLWGSSISSWGYCSHCSRPLWSFTSSSSSHVFLASSYSSSPITSSSEALLGSENWHHHHQSQLSFLEFSQNL